MEHEPKRPASDSFLGTLFADLAAGRFGARAWATFWRRAWQRSKTQRALRPRRRRSFALWTLLGAWLGLSLLGIAHLGDLTGALRRPALIWGIWYLAICGWVVLHLGRVRSEAGEHFDSFGIPNGLSFLRLGLAPLVAQPLLVQGPLAAAPVRIAFVVALALLMLSDLLDGWLARRVGAQSALGRVLDPLADLAVLSFLAYGLHHHHLLPTSLLVLLLLRYPGALVGAVVLYFLRGPSHLTASGLGKATTATTATLLVMTAYFALTRPTFIDPTWIRGALHALTALLALSLVHLLYRATRW